MRLDLARQHGWRRHTWLWVLLVHSGRCNKNNIHAISSSSNPDHVRYQGKIVSTVWQPRSLADDSSTTNDALQISLELSIWSNDESAQTSLVNDDDSTLAIAIRSSVVKSLQELWCTALTNVELLADDTRDNVCLDHERIRQIRRIQSDTNSNSNVTTQSMVRATPARITVRAARSNETTSSSSLVLSWTEWKVTYTVVAIGDLYVAEAVQNNPTMDISAVPAAALLAMQAVWQLTLDVNAMDTTLDALLSKNVNTKQQPSLVLVSSPLRHEVERFTAAATAADAAQNAAMSSWNTTASSFEPRVIYPMRIGGIVFWILTVLWVQGLAHCAKRRRHRKQSVPGTTKATETAAARKRTGTAKPSAHNMDTMAILQTPSAVDAMLHQSSQAEPVVWSAATTATTTTTVPTHNDNDPLYKAPLPNGDNVELDEYTMDNDPGRYWTGHVTVPTVPPNTTTAAAAATARPK
jgi:hypothetical protein